MHQLTSQFPQATCLVSCDCVPCAQERGDAGCPVLWVAGLLRTSKPLSSPARSLLLDWPGMVSQGHSLFFSELHDIQTSGLSLLGSSVPYMLGTPCRSHHSQACAPGSSSLQLLTGLMTCIFGHVLIAQVFSL